MTANTVQIKPTVSTLRPGERGREQAAPERTSHEPPLLEPAPDGLAERFAAAVGYGHPVRVFLAAALGGYILLVALMSSRTDDPQRAERDAAPGPVKAGKDARTLLIALGGTTLVIALCLVVGAYLLAR